eukprot:SM000105S13860  [mRNA]  locus=s105:131278:138194:+ [translate_table: standard]
MAGAKSSIPRAGGGGSRSPVPSYVQRQGSTLDAAALQNVAPYIGALAEAHSSSKIRRQKSLNGLAQTGPPLVEGWMFRFGRRAIGRSFFHKRYFMLEPRLLCYFKKKPKEEDEVPVQSLVLNGNCRVEDRGLETHHGHGVYVLTVHNRDRSNSITMAALNIQTSQLWLSAIEHAIDQASFSSQLPHLYGSMAPSMHKFDKFGDPTGLPHLPDKVDQRDSRGSTTSTEAEDDGPSGSLTRAATFGRGPPRDWKPDDQSGDAHEMGMYNRNWRLLGCQNALRIFEEIPEADAASGLGAWRAVGVVEASCSDIFELVMGMGETRYEWDAAFQQGSLVEEVDGHTAVIYHAFQQHYCPWGFLRFLWPRDLCYTRYWRRNDDGSYGGGYLIQPLRPRGGATSPRSLVQHLVQLDLKGWGAHYVPTYYRSVVLEQLNTIAGLREWFAARDEDYVPRPVQRMAQLVGLSQGNPAAMLKKLVEKVNGNEVPAHSLSPLRYPHQSTDDFSDDEDSGLLVSMYDAAQEEQMHSDGFRSTPGHSQRSDQDQAVPDLSFNDLHFYGSLEEGDHEDGQCCWSVTDPCKFRVRSKMFLSNKGKAPAGENLMSLVAVDWYKARTRMDHLARCRGCAAQAAIERGMFVLIINMQVPGATHYSMVFYFVAIKPIPLKSALQRFIDGDDSFRNSRFKLIPAVPKGSWIVRQSVGSTPCLLGKAVDCTYYRRPGYLEIDVNIGSSTVANGVLGLVFGYITNLVVDMAFLVQSNTHEELPERLIAAVRISKLQLQAAVSPPPFADEAEIPTHVGPRNGHTKGA